MEGEQVQRRLAAILAADVAGYSRLMGEDETSTVSALTAGRELFSRVVQQFHGRIVNAPGDSILGEFGSVVDAVACAVEIQRQLAEWNAERPAARRMQFRIGVNLGDVIVKVGDLYGDGVNIAARLQALADPGGICISGNAHAEVKTKLPLQFEFQGKKLAKNISEPVAVYRVLSKPGIAAEGGVRVKRPVAQNWRKMALGVAMGVLLAVVASGAWYFGFRRATLPAGLPVPEQPSIAVLPFTNMSGDPEQEYFSDGVTDTIITDLSKLRGLKVIARNSVFTYKGKAVDVREVSRNLGARYVLEGSIQKAEGRIRITAQLIDAPTGEHVWADRYDQPMEDLFTIQDEITRRIVTELDVKLSEGETARVWRRGTKSLEAYDYFLRARQAHGRQTRQDLAQARQLAEKAIKLDPNFAMAHFMVGVAHYDEAVSAWSEDPAKSFELARQFLQRAIQLDESLGIAYAMLGAVSLSYDLDHERAIEYARKAISVAPGGAFEHAVLSVFLTYSGQPEEGMVAIKRAFELSPVGEKWYYHPLGTAALFSGRYEEALDDLRKCAELLPDYIWCRVNTTIAYVLTDQEDKGRSQAKEVLRINPKFTVSASPTVRRIKDPAVRERFAAALRRVGLP